MFRRRERLSLDEVRTLYPVRAPRAEWVREGEEVRVTIHRAPGRLARAASWFFTIPPRRSFLLDRPGAAVWGRCDGSARVGDVAAGIAGEFGWTLEGAERAVLLYLGLLSERRLIGFSPVPAPAAPPEASR